MPTKLPAWEETVDDLPAWEETLDESEVQPFDDPLMASAAALGVPEDFRIQVPKRGVSAIAGGPQLRTPGDLSLGPQVMEGIRGIPSAAGQLTEELIRPLLSPTELEPRESAIGLTRDIVPTGAALTEATGVPKWITIPASGLGRTAAGFGEFLTSPAGIADIGVAMAPGIGLIQRAKFIKDMAQGAGESAGAIWPLIDKAIKNPGGITTEEAQQIAEGTADSALMLLGAGKLTSQQFSKWTGIRAPLGRMLESDKTRLSKDLAEQLKRSEPIPEQATVPPIRQLGIPQAPLTAEPFLQPGIPEMAGAALREAQGPRIEIPGELSALETLRREIEPPRIELQEPTRFAERIPGGGEAPYGKVSYRRPAEAPTMLRSESDILLERAGKKTPSAVIPELPAKQEALRTELYREAQVEREKMAKEWPSVYERIKNESGLSEGDLDALLIGKNVSHSSEIRTLASDLAANAPGGRLNKLYDRLANPNQTGRFFWGGTAENPKIGFDPDVRGQVPDAIAARKALAAVNKIRTIIGAEPLPDFFATAATPAKATLIEPIILTASDIGKMSAEQFVDYAKGKDQLAEQQRIAQSESTEALQQFASKATVEAESAKKAADASKPETLEAYSAAAAKVQFFNEALREKSSIVSKLEALKLPETGEGRLYSLPHPDAIKAIGVSTWNSAIDVAILAVKAGKAISQAVDDAVKYLRRQGKQFDEKQIRSNLEYEIKGGGKDAIQQTPETVLRDVQQPQVAQEGQVALPADAGRPPSGQTLEPPTADKPAFDPTTGEPAQLITEKASRAMESKVKIPAQADVTKVAEQINLFLSEIGNALETGGQFLAKELRPAVAKNAPAERGSVTSKEVNQYFVNKLSSIRKQMQVAKQKIANQADIESQTYFDVLQGRFEQAFRQVQELRRTSHESLYFWNQIKAEYQEIARAAGEMPAMKRQLPVIDQIVKDFRDKNYPQAGKHFVDYLRMNLFTMGSWTLDFGTNLVATASRVPAWAIMDMGALVTGKPVTRMLTATRALADNMRNWKPGERFRLPEQVEAELGTTAGGEFAGRGREVMVDFSEILKSKPELADKLRHVDKLIGAPVRMKRAVDGFFGRFGATAELYNRALIEGKSRGLKGDALKTFTEDFVQNPPPAALERAIKTGKELKFNRDLSKWEEAYSSSVAIKLFVESFPRWTLQFIRWGGEMIGANPAFFKDLITRKATPEDVVTYLTKAATGWAGIYAFNHLFYDNIDANTMEYVKEDGDRVRLAGRTPAPELFFISAMLRGHHEKAKAALAHLSVPGAKLLSGEPAGIISPLVDTIRQSISGRYTGEQTARELTKMANDAIPGKSVLGLIRSIFDPTIREGIGAPIPGVASLLPQRVNPTTGEPLAPKQKIPGTTLEIPTVGGTPFPGAVRVLNEIESTLMNHGLAVARPRRTSIIELPAEDVSKELRREYEEIVGRNVKRILGDGIQRQQFKDLPFEGRRLVLADWLEDARLISRVELARKHGTSAKPVKSTPLNVERMPERLRE